MRDPLFASTDLENLPVYDADELPIGLTFGVLTEADTGLVRFFDVSLEGRQRHVLVPVGHARIEQHMGRQRLRLRAASAAELDRIPAFEPHVTWHEDSYQNELLDAFGRLFAGDRYYAHPAFDHSGLYAGTHPLLRDPLAPASPGGLQRLSSATEFKVVDDQPDVRGWPLHGVEDALIGTVADLLIDTDAETVRYLIVKSTPDEKTTLLPVGYVDLANDHVRAPLSAADLAALPELSEQTISREDEVRLKIKLDALLGGERRYQRPDFKSAA